ncbi:MAG TPA: VOC family protein [Candidatus Thermoplasmatota archaeon]|nr:VOC family protein [Candidatus Thermoplasmatota archaeon]
MPVEGIGGIFLRSPDPKRLGDWYERHLGLKNGGATPTQAGPLVVCAFARDTDYFPSAQSFMVNLRVSDLPGLLRDLAAAGIVEAKPQVSLDGIGRFAWIADPDGNRIELWEPGG